MDNDEREKWTECGRLQERDMAVAALRFWASRLRIDARKSESKALANVLALTAGALVGAADRIRDGEHWSDK